jgi:hypothetical protein
MSKLMLDALFPPAPDQLVADLGAVGADGAMVYVSRPGGVGSWTPAHVQALRAAGKLAAPIIVPPPAGGDIPTLLEAAATFGFTSGPITLDLEPPNLPPASWEEQFDVMARGRGFSDFDYGTPSNLGLYAPDDAQWRAIWLRTGVLQPLPPAPVNGGWQFVNDIVVNSRTYDASVVADSVFSGQTWQPVPVDPTGTWYEPYVSSGGLRASQAVILPGICHAAVLAGVPGQWYQNVTPIGAPAVGQFAEWTLANLTDAWYDMDESGGPAGSPTGRLSPDQAFWITDAAVDTAPCGGTSPPAVAQARGGQWLALRWPAPMPVPVTPPPTPKPGPDLTAAGAALSDAEKALAAVRTALGL